MSAFKQWKNWEYTSSVEEEIVFGTNKKITFRI